jgi:hypothetical protein
MRFNPEVRIHKESYVLVEGFYCNFYGFLKFLRFFENINKNKKIRKIRCTVLGWHFSLRPGTVSLAQRQIRLGWPGRPKRRGTPNARSPRVRHVPTPGGSSVDEVGQGRRHEHRCGMGDLPDKVR